jgi:15-cis-phytoene synthase
MTEPIHSDRIASTVIHPDVITMAREGEPERYVSATLSPAPVRGALIALAAFAADLRRIPQVVKEPMMGEVRLQWWRDVIGTFDKTETTGHPIADALAAAVRTHALPQLSLVAMTEARAFDLYDDPMPDEAAFAGYLTKTEAIPFALAQTILSDRDTPHLSDLGTRSYGHVRVLAGLPLALAKGRVPLPHTLLKQHAVDPEALLAGHVTPGLRHLLQQSCREIATAHTALRQALRAASPADRLALLPAATVPPYIAAILVHGRDAARSPAEISPLNRVMRLALAKVGLAR